MSFLSYRFRCVSLKTHLLSVPSPSVWTGELFFPPENLFVFGDAGLALKILEKRRPIDLFDVRGTGELVSNPDDFRRSVEFCTSAAFRTFANFCESADFWRSTDLRWLIDSVRIPAFSADSDIFKETDLCSALSITFSDEPDSGMGDTVFGPIDTCTFCFDDSAFSSASVHAG